MSDFIQTSIRAGLLIFGTQWLLQKMKNNSDSDDIMNTLKQMSNGNDTMQNDGDMGMSSGELEKEMEMLMLQDGGMSAYNITENNPNVLSPNANSPLTVGAAAEHLSPLADSVEKIYPSNQKQTNFEKMNFAGRKTNVYPYTSNKIRQLQQSRARFQAQHADQYASMGPIRGVDTYDSPYMPFS